MCVYQSLSCVWFFDPMDSNPPDYSVHGILQARILECVAIPFSRGSSPPSDWTQVFYIADRFFIILATREGLNKEKNGQIYTDISPKKTYKWPIGIWKDDQHH